MWKKFAIWKTSTHLAPMEVSSWCSKLTTDVWELDDAWLQATLLVAMLMSYPSWIPNAPENDPAKSPSWTLIWWSSSPAGRIWWPTSKLHTPAFLVSTIQYHRWQHSTILRTFNTLKYTMVLDSNAAAPNFSTQLCDLHLNMHWYG